MTLQSNAELTQIWVVGQKMWQRDFAEIYESLNKDWSESVKPIMTAVQGKIMTAVQGKIKLGTFLWIKL